MLQKLFYTLLLLFVSSTVHCSSHTFTGTIGEYPIFITLMIEGSTVSGAYCYKKQLINIHFDGTLKNGTISLETTNPNDYVIDQSRFIPEIFKFKWGQEKITGTWLANGKTLPINLIKPSEKEIHTTRVKNNPLLLKQAYDDYDQLKIGQFRLKEIDSLYNINQLKIRTFKEINTGISLYRIDSGLNTSSLETANHYLEFLHINEFLSYYGCASQSGDPSYSYYNINFYDLTASNNLLSLAAFEITNCGYPHPNEYNYGINFNLTTQKEIKTEDYLKEGVDTLFQQRVINYFKTEYPSYFDDSEKEMDCEFNDEYLWTADCQFIFTNKGLELLPNFSHYRAPCYMPDWTVVPYSELKDLIKPEYWGLLNELKP